ncbi:MAG: DUF1565 domain-containing protein [Leptolyngbyaceae cyanobacterium SM2_3_12]|nr:DUF1565 domain-containing protein [Leptolyngbyaceae cyanobacterium SM2_3_12]
MVQTISKTLEVDPNRGNDQPSARPSLPFKTLTAALVTVQGQYLNQAGHWHLQHATGERFPITVPDGVMISGQEASQGEGVVISGGGTVPGQTTASVAVVVQGQGQLRGVTVQNAQGTGITLGEGSPLIRACRLVQCGRDGVQVTGTAKPALIQLRCEAVTGSGIRFSDRAKGEVKDCIFQRCGQGIYVEGSAAPLLLNNKCSGNQVGIQVTGSASPVLRSNRVSQNQNLGLWIQGNGRPDLGQSADEAGNIIRDNGRGDLRNDSGQALVSVGNDLLPQRVTGPVTLGISQRPDPAAVPRILLDQPITQAPTPQSAPIPGPVSPSSYLYPHPL